MKKFLRDTKGQGVVELALVLSILIMLLLGIVDMGLLFAKYVELEHVARDGARYVSVNYMADIDDPNDHSDASKIQNWKVDVFEPWITQRLNLLQSSDLTIDLITEPQSKSDAADQEAVQVLLEYPIQIITPFLGSVFPSSIKSKVVMRIE